MEDIPIKEYHEQCYYENYYKNRNKYGSSPGHRRTMSDLYDLEGIMEKISPSKIRKSSAEQSTMEEYDYYSHLRRCNKEQGYVHDGNYERCNNKLNKATLPFGNKIMLGKDNIEKNEENIPINNVRRYNDNTSRRKYKKANKLITKQNSNHANKRDNRDKYIVKEEKNNTSLQSSLYNYSSLQNSSTDSIENMKTTIDHGYSCAIEPSKKKRKKTSRKSGGKKKKGEIDSVRKQLKKEFEKEKEKLIAQWRKEFDLEQEKLLLSSKQEERNYNPSCTGALCKRINSCINSICSFLSYMEVFISNIPLTIGAVGLSWVTMGVIWFKFTEEMIPECIPTHYRSPQCTFLEFPGCFSGNGCSDDPYYRIALVFHYICHGVAGTCCLLFLLKVLLARRVVVDELSNPTQSTPMGVVCITMVCVFAGRGAIGEIIVVLTSAFHFCLAFWFYYMALCKHQLLPDPGWFPNTVGLAYASIKTWLYFPVIGKTFMVITMIFFFATFFVSIIRVARNHKISAPVCWIQISAPSITLYVFTLMQQPSIRGEKAIETLPLARMEFWERHHEFYLPMQHFMFSLTLMGMVSAIHALWCRWGSFKSKPFSPAHAAFCFPPLSHANSIQVYRGAIDAFSTIPDGSFFKRAIWTYWVVLLVTGSLLNLVFTYKYLVRLPKWTKINTLVEKHNEGLPTTAAAPPNDTLSADKIVVDRKNNEGAILMCHDISSTPSSLMSPAVLQANEVGALVRVRRGTEEYRLHGGFVRTRQVTSLGFDPTLSETELREERARLLDWVARNAPRTRNRTLSLIPDIFVPNNNDEEDDLTRGVHNYGSIPGHRRFNTIDNANGSDFQWL